MKKVAQQDYIYFKDEKEDKIVQKTLIVLVCVVFAFYLFLMFAHSLFVANYEYVTVNGLSMQPTLNSVPVMVNGKEVQDGVYIRLTNDVDYGDIIIIDKGEHSVIKRMIAKDGDKLSIAKVSTPNGEQYRVLRIKYGSNKVENMYEEYIEGTCKSLDGNVYHVGYDLWSAQNGRTEDGVEYESTFYSNYISNGLYQTSTVSYDEQEIKFITVSTGKFFYLGDNRTNSYDSRGAGLESYDNIIGRVVSIAHNASSYKNSWTFSFQKVGGYLEIVWKEIIYKFQWRS